MHHRSHDQGVCIQGKGVCIQGKGICIQREGVCIQGVGQTPPPPLELGKRVVRILLECFLVENVFIGRDSSLSTSLYVPG